MEKNIWIPASAGMTDIKMSFPQSVGGNPGYFQLKHEIHKLFFNTCDFNHRYSKTILIILYLRMRANHHKGL